jgi:hypothetical protein
VAGPTDRVANGVGSDGQGGGRHGLEDVGAVRVCIGPHVLPVSALPRVFTQRGATYAAGLAREFLEEVGGVLAADCGLLLAV